MIYKDFQDLKLSALGMGCMRLPVVGGNDAVVDEAAAEEMVDCAMANGVNYYDTAWGYHNGNSEIALGKALAIIKVLFSCAKKEGLYVSLHIRKEYMPLIIRKTEAKPQPAAAPAISA